MIPFLYAIEYAKDKKISLGGCPKNVINGQLFQLIGI